ncbi:purple acid phosphatase 15 isoform X3 [Olea europaea var. sylvestris]|uniref:purple acid phosphatase 15 isoform X3 n=1 Tax=Olea europaea var. sylvestris TaxID=158386 RepID=UPI000C1CD68D|nr:purple acid phosphatase 15 isoform X3 [Olea europaea var. sylvestris]
MQISGEMGFCSGMAVVYLVILNLLEVNGEIPTTLDGPFKPVTVPLDKSFRGNAIDLPDTDPRLQRSVTGLQPEQISVSLSSTHDSVWISWITGEFQIGDNIKPLDPKTVVSVVRYGKLRFPMIHKATGHSLVYNQMYPFEGLQNYTSGIVHHVRLTGLDPNTLYYYRCGDPLIPSMSDIYSFKTMPVSGPRSYPSRIAVVGDLGLTYNSSSTINHLKRNKPDLVLMVGDLSYANLYLTNGTSSDCYSCSFPDTPIHETYQPRWDYWGRFMQPLVSKVPIMMVQGNHEIELQAQNRTFASYSSRYAFPYKESGSSSPFYYSFNSGGIHFVVLGGYTAYSKTADQYKWLQKDLTHVNREVTPWLVATWHPPWYSSYTAHYREAECMMVAMEDLLYRSMPMRGRTEFITMPWILVVLYTLQLEMEGIERRCQLHMLMSQVNVLNHPPRQMNLWVDSAPTISHLVQQLVSFVGIDNLNIVHTGKAALAMEF